MNDVEVSRRLVGRSATTLAMTHLALVIGAIVVAVIARLPSALVLGAPSLVILISGWLDSPPAEPILSAALDRPRALEGDVVVLTATVRASVPVPFVAVEYLPHGRLDHRGVLREVFALEARTPHRVAFEIITEDWGVVQLGRFHVQTRDRFGLRTLVVECRITSTMRVHVREEPPRSLSEPDRFRRLVGSHLSEERGAGCEIADIRRYQPGDRLQAVNWRITARHGEPWVTLRHPDRSTTIVLLLDVYQAIGLQRADLLRRSIRATIGVARVHLAAQDPVGLFMAGQGVRWFEPELGARHLHVMTDALLDLSTSGWAERLQSRDLVDRLIPPDAVVLAISPLANQRFIDLLYSMRANGRSVQVVQPVTYWPAFRPPSTAVAHGSSDRAWRIYLLEQQRVRQRLANAGVPVVPWEEDQPIESVLLSLRMRQRARRIGMPVR